MKSYFLLSIFTLLCFIKVENAISQKKIAPKITYVCPPCNRKCDHLTFDKPGICMHCNMKLVDKSTLKDHPKPNRTKVGFYLQSGVEILDFAGPMEVFAYAGYDVFTISKTKEPIYAQGILTVIPDYDLLDAPQADILVFFGGNAVLPSKDKELITWIRSQNNTKYYFSVCSGALILAEAGILDNQKATTFRYTIEALKKFKKIDVLPNVRYVDNGKTITTAGVSAGIDGALHMVAKLEGLTAAVETAFYMEYEWTPNKGIILRSDNPYHNISNVSILKDYEGKFKSNQNQAYELVLDPIINTLFIIINNEKHPVFYIEKNRFFLPHTANFLVFERDKNDVITGLKNTAHSNLFIKQ